MRLFADDSSIFTPVKGVTDTHTTLATPAILATLKFESQIFTHGCAKGARKCICHTFKEEDFLNFFKLFVNSSELHAL